MAKKIVLQNGGVGKSRDFLKSLGMDSASDEDVKKMLEFTHGISKLALDEDDKKAKDEDDKKAEDEEVEIVEDSDDDKKAKDEQTQAERDNESEAERLKREEKGLKEREDRENKDRKRDRELAQDAATIEQNAINRIQGVFSALREVEPLVGQLAMDGFSSGHDVYAYALQKHGVDTKGVNTAGLRAVLKSTIAGSQPRSMAMDSFNEEPSSIFSNIKRV